MTTHLIIPDTRRPLVIELVFVLIDHSSLDKNRPYQYCHNQQHEEDVVRYPPRKHQQIHHSSVVHFLLLVKVCYAVYPIHNRSFNLILDNTTY